MSPSTQLSLSMTGPSVHLVLLWMCYDVSSLYLYIYDTLISLLLLRVILKLLGHRFFGDSIGSKALLCNYVCLICCCNQILIYNESCFVAASWELWELREMRLLYAVGNCALNLKVC